MKTVVITGSARGFGYSMIEEFYKKDFMYAYDILSYLPSRYEDRGTVRLIENLIVGENVCIKAKITSSVRVVRVRKSLTITRCTVADESGEIVICWYNQKYIDKALKYDETYTFYGKINKGKSGMEMVNPVVESLEKEGKYTGKIIPVYHGIYPISQKTFISVQESAFEECKNALASFIPKSLEGKYIFPSGERAVHLPSKPSSFNASSLEKPIFSYFSSHTFHIFAY